MDYDRIVTIFYNTKHFVDIPVPLFSLNDIAEYIIDNCIYRPGYIVNMTIRTVDKDNTVYMEEK